MHKIIPNGDEATDFELLLDVAQSIAERNPWLNDSIDVGSWGGQHCGYCGKMKWGDLKHADDCKWELAFVLVEKYRPKPKIKITKKVCNGCLDYVFVQRNEGNTGWVVKNKDGSVHYHPPTYYGGIEPEDSPEDWPEY